MSDGGRGKRAFRLSALAFAATCASATMIVWVAFLPGSCSFVGAAAEAETSSASSSFLTNAARFVPKTLITKYRNERGTPRRACVTHVLPSAAWSALAPFQLLAFSFAEGKTRAPGGRRRRAAHRFAGRALFATTACMTFGYVFAIHREGLHFHRHDFPSLESGAALSAAPPLAALWRVVGGADAFEAFEHACACWFFATAARAAFVAARGNRARGRTARRGARETSPSPEGWLRVHRAWAIRHLAAGYSVVAQRALIALAHATCRAWFSPRRAAVAERACASPAAQKGIFADALVLGVALCVAAGEVAIRDADALDEPEGKDE